MKTIRLVYDDILHLDTVGPCRHDYACGVSSLQCSHSNPHYYYRTWNLIVVAAVVEEAVLTWWMLSPWWCYLSVVFCRHS